MAHPASACQYADGGKRALCRSPVVLNSLALLPPSPPVYYVSASPCPAPNGTPCDPSSVATVHHPPPSGLSSLPLPRLMWLLLPAEILSLLPHPLPSLFWTRYSHRLFFPPPSSCNPHALMVPSSRPPLSSQVHRQPPRHATHAAVRGCLRRRHNDRRAGRLCACIQPAAHLRRTSARQQHPGSQH